MAESLGSFYCPPQAGRFCSIHKNAIRRVCAVLQKTPNYYARKTQAKTKSLFSLVRRRACVAMCACHRTLFFTCRRALHAKSEARLWNS